MKLYVVRGTTPNPLGPDALVFTDKDVADSVKKILGFSYKVSTVELNEIPKGIQEFAEKNGTPLPVLPSPIKTEVDTRMDREYTTFFNDWMFHTQGKGSSSRLVDNRTKKSYHVPHDENFRAGFTGFIEFLRGRL